MADPFTLPPPPDPTKVAQWAGLARTLVALAAGAGFVGAAWAGVSAEQIANLLTAVLTLAGAAGALWSGIRSWRQKAEQRAINVASSAASAALGQPVTVAVTPAGMPNVVTRISGAEIAAAPSAPLNVAPSPAPAP